MTASTRLWYTYQGFTNDGQYLVNFFYPVTTAKLPKQADMTAAEWDKFNSDPQAYIKAQAEMLNALAPADWQPDLAHSTRWSDRCASRECRVRACTMSSGSGQVPPTRARRTRSPIRHCIKSCTAQTARCRVKADCNQASGEYTYNGGMVGGVRVTIGPSTLAACGPDFPLGGVDRRPSRPPRTTACSPAAAVEAQHARRRSCLELPGQRRGGEVRRGAWCVECEA